MCGFPSRDTAPNARAWAAVSGSATSCPSSDRAALTAARVTAPLAETVAPTVSPGWPPPTRKTKRTPEGQSEALPAAGRSCGNAPAWPEPLLA